MSARARNAAFLRGRFVARVLERGPATVLDVGCGGGECLALYGEHGVRACGVEASAERVAALLERGLEAREGVADALPFEDGAFEVVTIRHVLHHLADPEGAVREAWRVAREGVVIAEPWLDLEAEDQRTSRAIDEWSKRQDRRLGHVHEDDVPATRIVEWLEACGAGELFYELVRRPGREPLDELRARLEAQLEDDSDRTELDELLARAARTGAGLNGSSVVVA